MTREQYESLSAAQLKSIAKTRGLKVSSGMRKSEVVNLMLEEDEKTAQTEKTVQKDETSEKQADKVAENSTYQEGTAEKKEKRMTSHTLIWHSWIVEFVSAESWKLCQMDMVLSEAIIIFREKMMFMYHHPRFENLV